MKKRKSEINFDPKEKTKSKDQNFENIRMQKTEFIVLNDFHRKNLKNSEKKKSNPNFQDFISTHRKSFREIMQNKSTCFSQPKKRLKKAHKSTSKEHRIEALAKDCIISSFSLSKRNKLPPIKLREKTQIPSYICNEALREGHKIPYDQNNENLEKIQKLKAISSKKDLESDPFHTKNIMKNPNFTSFLSILDYQIDYKPASLHFSQTPTSQSNAKQKPVTKTLTPVLNEGHPYLLKSSSLSQLIPYLTKESASPSPQKFTKLLIINLFYSEWTARRDKRVWKRMKDLGQVFGLVFIVKEDPEGLQKKCEMDQVKFLAIYSVTWLGKGKYFSRCLDYSQVYSDFPFIDIEKNIVIVSTHCLDEGEDIKDCVIPTGNFPKICVNRATVPSLEYPEQPLMFLVPSYDKSVYVGTMIRLSKYILKNCQKNFSKSLDNMEPIVWHGRKIETLRLNSSFRSASFPLILLESSVLHYQLNLNIPVLKAKSALSNSSILLVLNEEGQVFYLRYLNSDWPMTVEPNTLIHIQHLPPISQISLSLTHAACLTSDGQLFTWGNPGKGQLSHTMESFTAEPFQVSCMKCFKMTEVVCGTNFTAVLTVGCYVHIYGELGLVHSHSCYPNKKLKAFSHSLLNKEKIVTVQAGSNFLSALNESGEVFVVDGCMDLVRLPLRSEWKVESFTISNTSILGKVNSGIVLWDWSAGSAKDECRLSLATGKYFNTLGAVRAFGWGDFFLLDGRVEETGVELRPYSRSELGKAILKNNRRNTGGVVPEHSLLRRSKSFNVATEDLEKNNTEKILRCFEQKFSKCVARGLRDGFSGIKGHSLIKLWEKTSLRKTRLLNLVNAVQRKKESYLKFCGFYKMKLLSFNSVSGDLRLKKLWKIIEKVLKKNLLKCFKALLISIGLEKNVRSNKNTSKNELKNKENPKLEFLLLSLARLLSRSVKRRFFEYLLDSKKTLKAQKSPKDSYTILLVSILSSAQKQRKLYYFHKIKFLLKPPKIFSIFQTLPKRVLNLSFKLLTRSNNSLFRPMKSLLLKKESYYFSLLLISSFSKYNRLISNLLVSIESILSKCQIRHKIQSFKLLQQIQVLQTQSFSTGPSVFRTYSYLSLDPIEETPEKKEKEQFHSKSPSNPRFSLPAKLAKSDSHFFFSKSPSLRIVHKSEFSPKPADKPTEPKRPPWIPPGFSNAPTSPSRLAAQTRRKEYEEQLRSRKPKQVLKKYRKRLISPRPSKELTAFVENSFGVSFGLMELCLAVSNALKTVKRKAFWDVKLWVLLKGKTVPCEKDEKIKKSWKERLLILASAETQGVVDKVFKREVISY